MRSRKKLSMWSGLPGYLGGKRRLAGTIFREIDKVVPRRLWPSLVFLDAFLGGGSIALFAKAQGFRKVIGTDLALRSVIIGQALVANSRVRLTKDDVLRVLAPQEDGPGPIERDMVPQVFTRSQAWVMDNALALASGMKEPSKAALLRLLVIRLALLAHPYSYVRKGTIHRLTTGEYERMTPTALPQYVAGLRLATMPRLWELAQEINAGVFEGCGEVHQVDVVEALPGFPADILYMDPPYAGTLGYERTYRILDRILGDDRRDRSRFSSRDGAAELDRLLERAVHIPVWVLSFGHETVSLEELEGKMSRLGRRTRSIAVKYSRLAALAKEEKRSADREYLVVGWDEDAPLMRSLSVNRADLRDHAVGCEVDRAVPGVHPDANSGSTEAAAPEPLPLDRPEEGEPALPEESGTSRFVRELQLGVDRPDPVLGESSVKGNGKRSTGRPIDHGPTLPWNGPVSQLGRRR